MRAKTIASGVCIAGLAALAIFAAFQIPNIYSAPHTSNDTRQVIVENILVRDIPANLDLPVPDDTHLVIYDVHDPNLAANAIRDTLSTEENAFGHVSKYTIRLTPKNIIEPKRINYAKICIPKYEVFTKGLTLPVTQYVYREVISPLEKAILEYIKDTNTPILCEITFSYNNAEDYVPTYLTIKLESVDSTAVELTCIVHNYSTEGDVNYKTGQWVARLKDTQED